MEQSSSWISTDIAGAALNELVTGLSTNTAYHWRCACSTTGDNAIRPAQPLVYAAVEWVAGARTGN